MIAKLLVKGFRKSDWSSLTSSSTLPFDDSAKRRMLVTLRSAVLKNNIKNPVNFNFNPQHQSLAIGNE